MNLEQRRFWAKTVRDAHGREVPGVSVRDHCLNVGCVAAALIKVLPKSLQDLLPPGAVTLAALHDVGKLSVGFEQKSAAWIAEQGFAERCRQENWQLSETDHGKLTAWILRESLQKQGVGPATDKLAHVIGAHHGSLFGSKVFNKLPCDKASEIFQPARARVCEEMLKLFGPVADDLRHFDDAHLWLLAGLVSVADWIGSDERFFSPERRTATSPSRSIADGRNDANRALGEVGWRLPSVRRQLGFKELFQFDSPSEIQHQTAALAEAPGVVIVEAAMGAGKTEAALALTYRLLSEARVGGLYFALPTQVTSNRIYLRVREFLARCLADPAMFRLAHMNSWLSENSVATIAPSGRDDQTPDAARRWFASAKRALLAPFGVGTVDQALLGVVAAKHFFVRQFALAGKVVVLDEVHSYDLYTGTLVTELVRTLRRLGATVVILSATLTAERKRELLDLPANTPLQSAYPLLTLLPRGVRTVEELRSTASETAEVRVRCVQLPEAEATTECLRRAERGECVLWIRNTVAEAQAAMKRLRSDRCGDTPEIAVLHSRFPQFRRESLERLWLNRLGRSPRRRPRGCVLVATQVVEQSVDIDADFMLTDLAPTDMLLQRIGRLWRHQGRKEMAARRPKCATREVWVNRPVLPTDADADPLRKALGRSARVYAPYVLLRSLAEWQRVGQRGWLSIPGDIRPLLEATYDPKKEANDPAAWAELRRELRYDADALRAKALSVTRVWTMADLEDEEGVQTRWSKLETASLLLVRKARLFGKAGLELSPLRGQPFTITPHDWSLIAAKTIHRNLVRVDKWLVRDGCAAVTDALAALARALARYIHGSMALGIVETTPNGPIRWPGPNAPVSSLFYDENLGVERLTRQLPTHASTTNLPDEDECYD
jgi:CRISPR-associated endonuclease/helicase Cas3